MFGVTSHPTPDRLHVEYQPQVDLLFVWIGEPQKARNIEVEPGVYVRVSDEKRVVGIEILDCAVRFHRSPESIDRQFAEAKLREYAPVALAHA
jgi:uncharacterized protein YuzE